MGAALRRNQREAQHHDYQLGWHGYALGETGRDGLRETLPLHLWFYERQRILHCQLLPGRMQESNGRHGNQIRQGHKQG